MLLQLENVNRTYEGKHGRVAALQDISLSVDAGEFIAIRGPSGCGKTTLLLTVGTLLQPDSGNVTITGQQPYRLSADQRAVFRSETIGFVFQQFHLVPYLSVLDNVLAPALAGGDTSLQQRAVDLVEQFGLSDRAGHVPAQLSSGERQRCAMARALLKQPKLLLADEPTGNLDEDNARQVLSTLNSVAGSGTTVLLVTHDPRAADAADRQIVMSDGRIHSDESAAAHQTAAS